nr:MAG TPA: hypothetical protein [Caudoviricetes sp.]
MNVMSSFNRGYNEYLYELLLKRGYYMANCLSCRYYDKGCTNDNVADFDMAKDGDRVYCTFWLPPKVFGGFE